MRFQIELKIILFRSESPNRISREIFQALNDENVMKKRKQKARKLVSSFEDPYQVLLRTIRAL